MQQKGHRPSQRPPRGVLGKPEAASPIPPLHLTWDRAGRAEGRLCSCAWGRGAARQSGLFWRSVASLAGKAGWLYSLLIPNSVSITLICGNKPVACRDKDVARGEVQGRAVWGRVGRGLPAPTFQKKPLSSHISLSRGRPGWLERPPRL